MSVSIRDQIKTGVSIARDNLKRSFEEMTKLFFGKKRHESVEDLSVNGEKIDKESVCTIINHIIVFLHGIFVALTAQDYQVYYYHEACKLYYGGMDGSFEAPPNEAWALLVGVLIFLGVYLCAVAALVGMWGFCYLVLLHWFQYGKEYMRVGAMLSALSFVVLSFVSFVFVWHPVMPWGMRAG